MAEIERVLSSKKILVVAPHPDDESLGCGGLIAKLAASGSAFCVLFVTDGGASHRTRRRGRGGVSLPDENRKPPPRWLHLALMVMLNAFFGFLMLTCRHSNPRNGGLQ